MENKIYILEDDCNALGVYTSFDKAKDALFEYAKTYHCNPDLSINIDAGHRDINKVSRLIYTCAFVDIESDSDVAIFYITETELDTLLAEDTERRH